MAASAASIGPSPTPESWNEAPSLRSFTVPAGEVEPEVFEPRRQRRPPGVLAEHELVRRPPDVLGTHDLVGELLLEHAVLVNARLVGEGVLAHDGLVGLHVDAGDVG